MVTSRAVGVDGGASEGGEGIEGGGRVAGWRQRWLARDDGQWALVAAPTLCLHVGPRKAPKTPYPMLAQLRRCAVALTLSLTRTRTLALTLTRNPTPALTLAGAQGRAGLRPPSACVGAARGEYSCTRGLTPPHSRAPSLPSPLTRSLPRLRG